MIKLLSSAILVSMMAMTSFTAMADDDDVRDSNADSGSFLDQVEAANGVIIRVPVNENGEELAERAEMRVHVGETSISSNQSDIMNAWAEGNDVADQPIVADGEVTDSSTWGWYGYRSRGWARPYYYYNYRPRAYYYGSSYSYARPYYYNTNSYRYYYYNCY